MRRSRTWGRGVFLLGLGGAVLAAYAPAIGGPFIFDDLPHIVQNAGIRDLGDPLRVLNSGIEETRPVHLLTLALSYRLAGGLDPLAFRLFDVLLHLGVVALLYAMLLGMRRDFRAGGEAGLGFAEFGALLFALHPLATESVAYVNSRSGLLAAFFGLAALLLLLRSLDRPDALGRRLAYAGSLLCMVAALGSKENAATFAPLAASYLLLRPAPSSPPRRRWWPRLLPHFLLIGVVPLLYVLRHNPHGGTFSFGWVTPSDYFMTQVRVYAYFLLLCVAPLRQNIDYDFGLTTSPLDPLFLGSLALLALLAGIAWRRRRTAPTLTLGLVWFVVGLLPTNSLIPFRDLLAERHLYVSLMGICWIVALGLERLAHRWPPAARRSHHSRAGRGAALGSEAHPFGAPSTPPAAPRRSAPATAVPIAGAADCLARVGPRGRMLVLLLVAVLALSEGALTAGRNRLLAHPLELWQETVRLSPGKARAHANLGIRLAAIGRLPEAEEQLDTALRLDPGSHFVQYNVGVLRERTGRYEQALRHYERAYRLRPDVHKGSLLKGYMVAAAHAFRADDYRTAVARFARALELSPGFAPAHYNLAVTLLHLGDPAQAARHLRRALALRPGYRAARKLLDELAARRDQLRP